MSNYSRTDIPILTVSALAVLIAAVISMATITTNKAREQVKVEAGNPYSFADEAAKAGVEAGKWHIECHGWIRRGSLSPRYCINGAIYRVEWDEVNMTDSTVNIRSCGEYPFDDLDRCVTSIQAKVKLSFLPYVKNEILSAYYSQEREPIGKLVSK
jgi:hypothetical protein